MRPIKLKLSGLQSYREQQEVDFEQLTEAGVFGIFGPTGSGKSSLLDAITLALYGKVERAAGGTQGIMNQSEKTLAVSFTFELHAGDDRKRFRVERQFKRSGDVTVSNTVSRFIEITDGGEVVLADKLSDVTRCVEQQIGLGMQDFTRAVVLPQGKFAEFLSLTGKDRRSMLQRLFRLERFGDGLALRLQQRVKAAEAAMNQAAAEQQGLGDASSEALAAAELRCSEAGAEAAAARQALEAAERVHAELKEVRERQEALRVKQEQHTKLLADQPKVAALEAELLRLQAAERLVPALEAVAAAEAQQQRCASRREAAGRAYAARQEAAASAAAAWSAAGADAAAAEPRLALRLDQLAQARRLEGEAAALARELAAGERRFADAAARQAHASEEAAGLQDKLSRAAARQSELKTELRSVQLQPQERQQRLSLSSRLEQHAALTSQHTAVKGELADQLMAMQHSEQRLRALSGEQLQLLKQLSESAGQLAPLHSELQNLEQAVDDVVTALPSRIQEARQAERAREHAKLAEQLAEQLGSGEPCPVCGATEHPALHRGVREEKAVDGIHPGEWQTAIPYLEEILTRLRLAKPQITSLLQRSGELKLRLEEEAAHTEAAIHSVDAASAAYTADAAYPSAHTEQRRSILLSSASPLPGAADAAHPSAHTEQRRSILLSNTSSLPGDAYAADTARLQAAAASAVQLSGRSVEGGELGAWADLAESLTRQSMEWLQRSEAESTVLLRSKLDVERRHDKIQTELELLRKQSAAAQRKLEDAEQALSAAERLWDEQFPDVDRAKADDTLEEWNRREQASDELALRLERSVSFIETTTAQLQQAQQAVYTAGLETTGLVSKLEQERATLSEKEARLGEWTGGEPAEQLYTAAEQELAALRLRLKSAQAAHEGEAQLLQQAGEARAAAEAEARAASEQAAATSSVLQQSLALSPFSQADEAAALVPLLPHMDEMAQTIKQHREADNQLQAQIRLLKDQLLGRAVTEEEWGIALHTFQDTKQWDEAALQLLARAQRDRDELHSKHARWTELEQRRIEMKTLLGRLHTLQSLFRGNAFVEFVAEEQLAGVCRAASERLSYLTRRRYALEVDSGGGFVIRDDANGGIRRPVSSLSGGETFLASLALALALSAQIQLRGRYPLQFFFLDEGFGTLDPELLDIVITALEKLQTSELSVGVISHVPELRSRLARRLVVHPAEPSGQGSRIQIETM